MGNCQCLHVIFQFVSARCYQMIHLIVLASNIILLPGSICFLLHGIMLAWLHCAHNQKRAEQQCSSLENILCRIVYQVSNFFLQGGGWGCDQLFVLCSCSPFLGQMLERGFVFLVEGCTLLTLVSSLALTEITASSTSIYFM